VCLHVDHPRFPTFDSFYTNIYLIPHINRQRRHLKSTRNPQFKFWCGFNNEPNIIILFTFATIYIYIMRCMSQYLQFISNSTDQFQDIHIICHRGLTTDLTDTSSVFTENLTENFSSHFHFFDDEFAFLVLLANLKRLILITDITSDINIFFLKISHHITSHHITSYHYITSHHHNITHHNITSHHITHAFM